jgi:hypothetical protein
MMKGKESQKIRGRSLVAPWVCFDIHASTTSEDFARIKSAICECSELGGKYRWYRFHLFLAVLRAQYTVIPSN